MSSISTNETFIQGVRDTQIHVKKVTYSCKPQNSIISRSAHGSQSLSLSKQYLDHLDKQSSNFEQELVNKFSKFCKHKFLITVNADPTGNLDLENLKIEIRISCPDSITTTARTFKSSLDTLLPFAEYLEKITVGIHDHRVRVVEGEFTISAEELIWAIQEPIRYEKIGKHWLNHFQDIYLRSKSVFSFEATLDVFEGQMYADAINIDLRQTFPKC